MKQVFCRHRRLYIWLLADLTLLASYLLLRGNRACMNAAAGFTRPLRAALGRLSYLVDFSVMEVLCVLAGLAALAGPGVNLALALLCCSLPQGAVFAGINLVLACFNMIPVGRLDGGMALHCALALLVGTDWAERTGRSLDLVCTVILLILGATLAGLGGNITLFLVAVWLLGLIFCGNCGVWAGNRSCHRRKKRVE